jgi:hypothetical protein
MAPCSPARRQHLEQHRPRRQPDRRSPRASRLVALGTNGTIYTREITGTTWTAQTSPLAGSTLYGVINAQSTYTAVGAGSASIYAY